MDWRGVRESEDIVGNKCDNIHAFEGIKVMFLKYVVDVSRVFCVFISLSLLFSVIVFVSFFPFYMGM